MRRTCRFASLPALALACWPAVAAAQSGPALPVGPVDTVEGPRLPDFRMPGADYRAPPGPVQGGLIAALPVAHNLDIAVGRFAVPELPRPRNNIEPVQRPMDVRRRDRGIAAVGISLRF